MFTLEQIASAHAKVQSGKDFRSYISEIRTLGVIGFETQVSDGSTHYSGSDTDITSPGLYPPLIISPEVHREDFIRDLRAHQRGETDFLTFCRDCATSGIASWSVDTGLYTCTYMNTSGWIIFTESF